MISLFRRWADKPLDRGKAMSVFFVNQLATPGLGSLMAGRRVAGSLQLLLATAGFGIFLAWWIRVLILLYNLMSWDAPSAEPDLRHRWWKTGVVLFGIAWLWSLVTSISLLREARGRARRALLEAEDKPPVIANTRPPV